MSHNPFLSSWCRAGYLGVGAIASGLGLLSGHAMAQDVVFEDYQLTAIDASRSGGFGRAVSVRDGLIAVGADDAAYVYNAETEAFTHKLLPSNGEQGIIFGYSIAIGEGLVVVGAPGDTVNGVLSGSAFVFDATTGEQVAKLLPDDGGWSDQFGFSVAIENGLIAVGAAFDSDTGLGAGSICLFDALTGVQVAKLMPDDTAGEMAFGWSVALGDGVLAVGAAIDPVFGRKSGSAYAFDAATGTQTVKLVPSDGEKDDYFGQSVAVGGGLVAVGSFGDDDAARSAGAAYVLDAQTGEQITKFVAEDGDVADELGWSIAMSGGLVAAGAHYADGEGEATLAGAVYVFEATTGDQIAKLVASDANRRDELGFAVAMDGDLVVAGASRKDTEAGENAGAVYVFRLNLCPADLNADGRVTGQDVRLFVRLVQAQDPAADLNGDGVVSVGDLVEFVQGLRDGCR